MKNKKIIGNGKFQEGKNDFGEFIYFCPEGHQISFFDYENEECGQCEEEEEIFIDILLKMRGIK